MTEIKWGAPPKDRRTGNNPSPWAGVAAALKERPGEWALIAEDVSAALSTNISKGRTSAFAPAGSFEATVRLIPNHPKRRGDVYARFVGEDGEHR